MKASEGQSVGRGHVRRWKRWKPGLPGQVLGEARQGPQKRPPRFHSKEARLQPRGSSVPSLPLPAGANFPELRSRAGERVGKRVLSTEPHAEPRLGMEAGLLGWRGHTQTQGPERHTREDVKGPPRAPANSPENHTHQPTRPASPPPGEESGTKTRALPSGPGASRGSCLWEGGPAPAQWAGLLHPGWSLHGPPSPTPHLDLVHQELA